MEDVTWLQTRGRGKMDENIRTRSPAAQCTVERRRSAERRRGIIGASGTPCGDVEEETTACESTTRASHVSGHVVEADVDAGAICAKFCVRQLWRALAGEFKRHAGAAGKIDVVQRNLHQRRCPTNAPRCQAINAAIVADAGIGRDHSAYAAHLGAARAAVAQPRQCHHIS
eukprot:5760974-Prymnesium_polylepis.2